MATACGADTDSTPPAILAISHSEDPELTEHKKSPAEPGNEPSRSPTTTKTEAAETPTRATRTATSATTMVIDKTLASASNLSKLLPTGTVLVFQALSPSFTNKGHCYASNRILTYVLIVICVASCVFFTFTDSLTGRDGQLYYGLATSKGLYILNFSGDEGERSKVFQEDQLRRLRRRWVDWVHAQFGVAVFLALAFGDGNVQSCFFPAAGGQSKELLVNLPLGAAVFASLVFMVFPTSRKGIGYTEGEPENR